MTRRRRFSSFLHGRCWQALALGLLVTVITPGCGDDSASDYDLEIAIGSSGLVSALQFDLTYTGDSGRFLGRGGAIDCIALVNSIIAANYRGQSEAAIGMISLQGVPTPAPIVSCGFRTADDPSAASFQINVTDSSGPDGEPIDPAPVVSITSISLR